MSSSRFGLTGTGSEGPAGLTLDGEVENCRLEIGLTSLSLTVSKLGTVTGTVSSSDVHGIDRGVDGDENFDLDSEVTLSALPTPGSACLR